MIDTGDLRKGVTIELEGNLYTASQLKEMGLVDIVVPVGEGVAAVEQVIKDSKRIPHAWAAMREVNEIASMVPLHEMMRITEIWVDTAMQLGEKSLRTMDRLVRAQAGRPASWFRAVRAFDSRTRRRRRAFAWSLLSVSEPSRPRHVTRHS